MSDSLNFDQARKALKSFDFQSLFIGQMGWNAPTNPYEAEIVGKDDEDGRDGPLYHYKQIAALGDIPAIVVTRTDGRLPEKDDELSYVHSIIKARVAENLLLFTNSAEGQSRAVIWYWVGKDADGKELARRHTFYQYQNSIDLLNKLAKLFVSFEDLDREQSSERFVANLQKLRAAFDVEKVTREFYENFKSIHDFFVNKIEGIDDEHDRRWYASVLLNRIMFIYFLQRRLFLGKERTDFLNDKLLLFAATESGSQYYHNFLRPLFFEGFAVKTVKQTLDKAIFGSLPYLNGGLFLEHEIEEKYGTAISIPNDCFAKLFDILAKYEWTLNEDVDSDGRTISPSILGYIFEKYINQKQFGAYYTRPEITSYLCEQCIHAAVFDKLKALNDSRLNGVELLQIKSSLPATLLSMDRSTALVLLRDVLPTLSVLDPACGSGAFLVAAMNTLKEIYRAALNRLLFKAATDAETTEGLKAWREQSGLEKSVNHEYFIKKRIITDNLYGVDIMDEAVEIARLRLFLDLVASADPAQELEALPNIDFNILAGNSLIGLLRISDEAFAERGQQVLSMTNLPTYVREYHRLRDLYKSSATNGLNLLTLRDDAMRQRRRSMDLLADIMAEEFRQLKIKREPVTWDQNKHKIKKSEKVILRKDDIDTLTPLHWGIDFQRVMESDSGTDGGFDVILANPPWEGFKPQDKEFFAEHSELVKQAKNAMRIEDFTKQKKELLQDENIRRAYEEYLSRWPHMSKYYRSAHDYQFQSVKVNGKMTGSDINLYKLFVERCYRLLRKDGHAGLVLPGGIYSDLGATGLRKLLLDKTRIKGLFGFENRKGIFEGVHRSFKFIVLTLQKGGETESFPATFMRHDVKDLEASNLDCIQLSRRTIESLSGRTYSFPELTNTLELNTALKFIKHPLLSDRTKQALDFTLTNEFHMTNDSALFSNSPSTSKTPLFTGKMFHQFELTDEHSGYWIDENVGRKRLLGRAEDIGQDMDYQGYRWVHRRIARNTDSRTMISTVTPKNVFTEVNSTTIKVLETGITHTQMLFLCAIMNSFALDWFLRKKVSTTLNMFYIYQLPVPRIDETHWAFRPLVEGAARLICTSPEYDDLAAEVGLGDHTQGAHSAEERAGIRARLDGIVAHLYDLTHAEFTYILGTFPIVEQEIKDAALAAFDALAPNPRVMSMIGAGESEVLEFKQYAFATHPLQPAAKPAKVRAQNLLEAIAAFLNSYGGGTVILGVADDGSVTGLEAEYAAANPQKNNADGLILSIDNLLHNSLSLAHPSEFVKIDIEQVFTQDVMLITILPAPEAVYVGQSDSFYVRSAGGKQELRGKTRDEFTARRFAG